MNQHGTRSSYVRGCRCDQCRSADREYSHRRRQSALRRRIVDVDLRDVARVPAHLHGVLGTYKNHLCRCEKCTGANREYEHRRQAARPRRHHAPAAIWPRPCGDCLRPMRAQGQDRQPGEVRHEGRNLCSGCHRRALRNGSADNHPLCRHAGTGVAA